MVSHFTDAYLQVSKNSRVIEKAKMRRVLNIVHGPFWAGPHNRIYRLTIPLREMGWETMVVLPDRPASSEVVAQRHRETGARVFQVPLRRVRRTSRIGTHIKWGFGFFFDVERLRQVIKRSKPDVVVIGGLANVQGGFSAALAKAPTVWQVTDTATPQFVVGAAMPVVERLSQHIMFNGAQVRRVHIKNGAPRADWSDYLPPVDTELFQPRAGFRWTTRASLGIPSSATVVGMVAKITPEKGIEYFVECAARIARRFPNVYFVCVGGELETHKDYAQKVYRLAQATGLLGNQLIFTGQRSDVHQYYPSFDLKIISSIPNSEGTTTTAMEAAACGLPVVAADVGAVREVVKDGEEGIVVTPLDVDELSAAVSRLIQSPATRRDFGRKSRKRALREFDVRRCAAVHEEAFLNAIRKKWEAG